MILSEARNLVRVFARQIVNNEIDPYEGAMQIWKLVLDKLEGRIPDDLWPFKSNASAIEDYLWNAKESVSNYDAQITQCKNEIKSAAKAILLNGFK